MRVIARYLITLVSLVFCLEHGASAVAETSTTVGVGSGPGVIEVTGDIHIFEDPTNLPASATSAGGPNRADPVTVGAVLVPEVQLDAAGNRCVYVTAVDGDPSGAAAANGEAQLQRLLNNMPYCPNSPITTAPPMSPAAAAAYAWRRDVPLPVPAPNIDPGYAIAGKAAYLETGDSTSFGPIQVSEFGFAITITAVGTYEVRWGDGSITGPGLTSTGGKWPTGDVNHAYDNDGSYRLQVIETWHGRYTINGQSGDLTDPITTEGNLDPFPVRQIQAVLTS